MEPLIDDELYSSKKGLDNVEYAGFWVRLAAMLLDGLILAPITLLSFYNTFYIKSPIFMVLVALLAFCYKPYMEWKYSDTFGKRLMKIKVVDEQGNNISQKQAFDRYAPWVISFLISMGINISLYMSDEFYALTNIDDFNKLGELAQLMPLNKVSSFYTIVMLVLVGSAGTDILKQGYHDKFAKTFCIYK